MSKVTAVSLPDLLWYLPQDLILGQAGRESKREMKALKTLMQYANNFLLPSTTENISCYSTLSWHWARLDGSWECQTSALPSLLRWSSFSLLPTPLGCNLISGNCVSHPCGPAINTNIQCLFNCPASALLEFPGPWSVGGTADEVRTRLWGLSCP